LAPGFASYSCRKRSYLENFAPLAATVAIFTGLVHAQSDTVEKDHSHGETFKPAETEEEEEGH
jgi:hypothetical protein